MSFFPLSDIFYQVRCNPQFTRRKLYSLLFLRRRARAVYSRMYVSRQTWNQAYNNCSKEETSRWYLPCQLITIMAVATYRSQKTSLSRQFSWRLERSIRPWRFSSRPIRICSSKSLPKQSWDRPWSYQQFFDGGVGRQIACYNADADWSSSRWAIWRILQRRSSSKD